MKDNTKTVELYSGTQWEAELLLSLLENAKIEAFLKDEIMGTTFPWHASPAGASPVKVVIANTDLEIAQQILHEFKKNKSS